MTKWFRDDPRLAYEVGLEVHMDVLHAGSSWFNQQGNSNDISAIADRLNGQPVQSNTYEEITPSYSWSIRPQTGASFGIRHVPDSGPLKRSFRSKSTWGAMGPSGSAIVRRSEWGVRGAMLVGPSFNGLEATLVKLRLPDCFEMPAVIGRIFLRTIQFGMVGCLFDISAAVFLSLQKKHRCLNCFTVIHSLLDGEHISVSQSRGQNK